MYLNEGALTNILGLGAGLALMGHLGGMGDLGGVEPEHKEELMHALKDYTGDMGDYAKRLFGRAAYVTGLDKPIMDAINYGDHQMPIHPSEMNINNENPLQQDINNLNNQMHIPNNGIGTMDSETQKIYNEWKQHTQQQPDFNNSSNSSNSNASINQHILNQTRQDMNNLFPSEANHNPAPNNTNANVNTNTNTNTNVNTNTNTNVNTNTNTNVNTNTNTNTNNNLNNILNNNQNHSNTLATATASLAGAGVGAGVGASLATKKVFNSKLNDILNQNNNSTNNNSTNNNNTNDNNNSANNNTNNNSNNSTNTNNNNNNNNTSNSKSINDSENDKDKIDLMKIVKSNKSKKKEPQLLDPDNIEKVQEESININKWLKNIPYLKYKGF